MAQIEKFLYPLNKDVAYPRRGWVGSAFPVLKDWKKSMLILGD